MREYSPSGARKLLADHNLKKSLTGGAPTVEAIVKHFDWKTLSQWFTAWLVEVSQFLGYSNLPNSTQCEGIAGQFYKKFGSLRTTEVIYYFELVKDGRFYDANIRLEPVALLKGVNEYIGYLNQLKEQWGKAEEFNDENMRKFCKQMILECVDLSQYPQDAMATLLGWYLPVSRQKYNAISEKVARLDNTWVLDLKKAS